MAFIRTQECGLPVDRRIWISAEGKKLSDFLFFGEVNCIKKASSRCKLHREKLIASETATWCYSNKQKPVETVKGMLPWNSSK